MKLHRSLNKFIVTYVNTRMLAKTFILLLLFMSVFLFGLVPQLLAQPFAYADEMSEEDDTHTPTNTATAEEEAHVVEETRSVEIIRIIEPSIYLAGDEAVWEFFDQTVLYRQDDFSGTLARESLRYEPAYQVEEKQVERFERFAGLPSDDLINVPTSMSYEVSSDTSVGARTTEVFEMTAVSWMIDAYDEYERPVSYTAEVTYRGVERELVYDYITATAIYSGTVVGQVAFEPELIAPAPVPLASPVASAQENNLLLHVLSASATIVMLGALALILLFRYWNVRLVAINEVGSAKTIMRKHVRLSDGIARVTIPANCELTSNGPTHFLYAKESLVNKGAMLSVIWRDALVLQRPLEREIDLQQSVLEVVTATPLTRNIGSDFAY